MSTNATPHLNDEQLVEAYYGEISASEHLNICGECRGRFERFEEMLDSLREFRGPERDAGYGAAVWNRIAAEIPSSSKEPRRRRWFGWWTWAPAFSALLVIAFLFGR